MHHIPLIALLLLERDHNKEIILYSCPNLSSVPHLFHMEHHISHPLIEDCLTQLRDKNTPVPLFRQILDRLTLCMIPAITQNLPTQKISIQTPLEKTEGSRLSKSIILVPILRAGLGMQSAFLQCLPEASVAHMGLSRNEENHEAQSYYFKAPQHLQSAEVFLLDPMLATGGSASHALHQLKQHGAQSLRLVSILATSEGIQKVRKSHPNVPIFFAACDRELDENAFILPGLGDAGDRIFGTEYVY